MIQYFPIPYEPFRGDINAKINLSNYATKTDLKRCGTCRCQQFCTKIKVS